MKKFTTTLVMLCALVVSAFAADGDAFSPESGKYYCFKHAASYAIGNSYFASFAGTDGIYNGNFVLEGHNNQESTWGFSAFKLTAVDGEDGYFYISLAADPNMYVYALTTAATTSTSDMSNVVTIGNKPDEFTDAYKWQIIEQTRTNSTSSVSETTYGVYTKLNASKKLGWNFYGGYSAYNPYVRLYYSEVNSTLNTDWGCMWIISEADAWNATTECTQAKNDAQAKLAKTGVGYPTTDAANRKAMQTSYDLYTTGDSTLTGTEEGAWRKYQSLLAATNNYNLTENVQLPEDGKVYRVYVQYSDGTKLPVVIGTDGQNSVATETSTTATALVMQKTADGKYKLGSLTGENTLWFRNADGTLSGMSDAEDFTIASTSYEGTVSLYGHTPNNTGSTMRYLAANQTTGAWDQMTSVSNNLSNCSATFVFEEVTDDVEYKLNVTTQIKEGVGASDDWEKDKYFATVNLPYSVTLPDDVTAYKAEMKNNNTVVELTELTLTNKVLPFETPVIVMSETEGEKTLKPAAYQAKQETGFTGTLYRKALSTTGVAYALGTIDGRSMFFRLNDNTTLAANKAYIDIPNASAAQALSFVFAGHEATGIDAVSTHANAANAAIYDLSGRRVFSPAKGGIYIKNGKKVIF